MILIIFNPYYNTNRNEFWQNTIQQHVMLCSMSLVHIKYIYYLERHGLSDADVSFLGAIKEETR